MGFVITEDSPEREDVRALIAEHLADMFATSSPESVHALDVSALLEPTITFWTARQEDGTLLGTAAIKRLTVGGELKSMRTPRAARGLGAGRALLEHAIAEATARGWSALWLETGTQDYFVPARTLYASRGFVECGPFEGYALDPESTFMRLDLAERA
ncbi:MAG: GNAT family N-acetyltransferase [Microbacteriaceae bacterium]|nr:GNAT family N-acetyltransferase [Microbacteriaceae bacterium]